MNINIKLLLTAPSSTRKRRETYASSISINVQPFSLQTPVSRRPQSAQHRAQSSSDGGKVARGPWQTPSTQVSPPNSNCAMRAALTAH